MQSYWFWPSVGGLESVSHTLAEGWSKEGHSVTVLTHTRAGSERLVAYKVVRNPSWLDTAKLVRNHDVIYSNGSTTHLFPFALYYGKPFVWTHPDCSMKWIVDPSWAVERPGDSMFLRQLSYCHPIALSKVFGRWLVAQFAGVNVAITRHMAELQQLPRQRVIYNPVDYSFWGVENPEAAKQQLFNSQYNFGFLGRLIKEKGVDDLLYALALVNNGRSEKGLPRATLQVIGDGPDRSYLEKLSSELSIADCVKWTGALSGERLLAKVRESCIFVVPSRYHEPMGIVALELLSAGKPIIVSAKGGLAECAGDACLTFQNGDRNALSQAMETLIEDRGLQKSLVSRSLERVKLYGKQQAIVEYLKVFEEQLGHTS